MDIGRLPAFTEEQGGSGDIFGQRSAWKVTNLIESGASNDVARARAPGDTHGVLDRLGDADEKVQTLAERIVPGDVVEQLGRAGEGHLVVHQQMRKHGTEPLLFRNHVGVEGCHVFTGTSGHVVNIVQAVVQVSSFEVMWDSGEFRSAFIKDVGKGLPHIFNGVLEGVGLSIVEEKHSEPIGRIVEITRCSDGVHDDVEIFTTAGDKHVDGRDVVTEQTQLWPPSLLHDEQRPESLEEDGNGDTDLDGDKQPRDGKGEPNFCWAEMTKVIRSPKYSQYRARVTRPRMGAK